MSLSHTSADCTAGSGDCDQLHEGTEEIGRELQRWNEMGLNEEIELREQAHQIGHTEALNYRETEIRLASRRKRNRSMNEKLRGSNMSVTWRNVFNNSQIKQFLNT